MNSSELPPTDTPNARAPLDLEQGGDYSQFLLHSKPEILSVLRALVQKGAMTTVYFDQGRSFLLTSLLGVNAEEQSLILDPGSDEEMNRRALQANKLIFIAFLDKVKIQFHLNGLTRTQHEGRPAFLGSTPETLLRLQRRQYFRLHTPITNPVEFSTTLRREDGSSYFFSAPLSDISLGGVKMLVAPKQAELLQRGDFLENCKIVLPHEGTLLTTLEIRYLAEVAARNGTRQVHIGGGFVNLPDTKLSMIQRYITQSERERKARLSGLG